MEKLKNEFATLRLQDRDLRLLVYMAANHFAPTDIIRDLFWNEKKTNAYNRRLRKLRKLGLVEPHTSTRAHTLSYRITDHGRGILNARGISPLVSGARRNYGSTYHHDRKVHYVRQIFESSSCVGSFYSELEVQKMLADRHGAQEEKDERYRIPDALVTLKRPNECLRAAIELEISDKSLKQKQRMFELLATSHDFDCTLVVANTNKHKEQLERILEDARKENPTLKYDGQKHGFYFITYDDLLRDRKQAKFQGQGGYFSLQSLESELLQMSSKVSP